MDLNHQTTLSCLCTRTEQGEIKFVQLKSLLEWELTQPFFFNNNVLWTIVKILTTFCESSMLCLHVTPYIFFLLPPFQIVSESFSSYSFCFAPNIRCVDTQ